MSWQNIPLKGRIDLLDPAEFLPPRLFPFELRRWEAQLGPSARISAGCLRWQEWPRFSADAEMIRRRILGLPLKRFAKGGHCGLAVTSRSYLHNVWRTNRRSPFHK